MTYIFPFVLSQLNARNGAYSGLAHDSPTSFCFQPISCMNKAIFSVVTIYFSIPHTFWGMIDEKKLQSKMVMSPKFSFTFRALKKTVMVRILTQNVKDLYRW